jgi:alpha-1,2-mannosyltransferase
LSIYTPLHTPGVSHRGDNVCLGKEWYRFPSSYLLPDGVRPKFIKSEFTGLLPGEFSEAAIGFGLFPGTWLVPPGMNDANLEDPGKYTDIQHCQFLVDSKFPSTEPTALEPAYMEDTKTWEKVKCASFMDAAHTGIVGRLLWMPDLPGVPEGWKRQWGEYCLLRRKDGVV